MGHTLELSIIAEGVETEALASFLAGVSSNDVQGYLYGKPVSIDQFQYQKSPSTPCVYRQ